MIKIDLTFGNPSFLNEYWKSQDLPDGDIYAPWPYMNLKQNPHLEATIRRIHKAIGNVANVDDYKIVIGNGASQLLSAILYETPDIKVTAQAPYFLRFPVLALIGNNEWSHKPQFKNIITAPNNPTGGWGFYDDPYRTSVERCEIIDACYNWPQYTKVRPLNDDIIIFSLSKATGHAGTRLGWALIKDSALAENVMRSIENSTMGVSNMSQEVGRFVLNHEAVRNERGDETCFSYGRQVLNGRWEKLHDLEDNLPFKLLNDDGMFLYAEGEIPDHVQGILGGRFGDSNKKFRLNIGCSIFEFSKFIKEYEKEEDDDFDQPIRQERIFEMTEIEVDKMLEGFVPEETGEE